MIDNLACINQTQFDTAKGTVRTLQSHNDGPRTSAVRKEWFDDRGNLCWSMDELGRVTSRQYNPLTGRLARAIEDIDAATAAALQLAPPVGWTLPASGGANLATDYQFDAFGRVTRTLGPAHTALVAGTPTSIRAAAWTVYNDAAHETRHAQGYALAASPYTETIVGPISITRTDRDGRTTERIQAAYSGTLAGLASATVLQSDYTAWTTYQYSKTRLVSTRVYDDTPSSGSGTEGTNYEQTSYGYETFGAGKMGRQNRTLAPDGWPMTDWQGTIRDVATYNAATNVTTIANHKVYEAFGKVHSKSGPNGRHDLRLHWPLLRRRHGLAVEPEPLV